MSVKILHNENLGHYPIYRMKIKKSIDVDNLHATWILKGIF